VSNCAVFQPKWKKLRKTNKKCLEKALFGGFSKFIPSWLKNSAN